jgi:hypothetical protein
MQSIDRETHRTPEAIEHDRGIRGRTLRDVPPRNPTADDVRDVLWYALFDAATPTVAPTPSAREMLAGAIDAQVAALLQCDLQRWMKYAADYQGTPKPHVATPELPHVSPARR